MDFLTNLDLFSVGITVAAIGILGFTVFFTDRKSYTNRAFLLFALVTIFWGIVNYLSYRVSSPILILWLLRLVIASATLHAFSFFTLFYIFPKTQLTFPNWYKFILFPISILVFLINLTPLSFSRITQLSLTGSVSTVEKGPGMLLFVSLVIFLIAGGLYTLIKKMRCAIGLEKTQFKYIFFGTILTFTLIFGFNFFLPAAFDYVRLIPLGAVFIFPFVAFTAYAIFKHHLLNTKIIATEILTFVLAIVTLMEVVLSKDVPILVFRGSTFLLILSFGILLIKSVLNEVRQREQLQILTGKLKEENKQLKILDQARAEFISMASHQLRTPPSSIKWYLSALLADEFGKLPPEIKEALVRVNTTNNSMISLIDALLNVSRIERGKLEFVFEEADLAEITQITIDQLAPLAREKGLELVYNKPAAPLPKLIMDKEKLRQVINNMIDNAIKYSKKGKIEISIEKTKRDATLKVRDNGKGMSAKELDVSFSKYGRGKDSIKYSAGLGLGMYLAKVIVEQHNGKIWAESPGADKGSTFAFSVPINNKIKPTSLIFDLTKTQNVK